MPQEYFELTEQATPAIFLSGAYDPVTPPRWADYVAQFFPNSTHLIAPSGHHIVSNIGCAPKILERFIAEPSSVDQIDGSCLERAKPLSLFIDGAGPNLTSNSNIDSQVLSSEDLTE